MPDNKLEYTFGDNNAYATFGLSPETLQRYINAGIVKPVSNGVFEFSVGGQGNMPKYFHAAYDNGEYKLTAIGDTSGYKEASIDTPYGYAMRNNIGEQSVRAQLGNLGIQRENGINSLDYSVQRPMFGGQGMFSGNIDNTGNRYLGFNFTKEF